jgi:hypothetical protein
LTLWKTAFLRLSLAVGVGAEAEILVFDYECYRNQVVPALVELLRTGEPVPWLGDVFRSATPTGEYGYDVVWPRLASQLREQPTDLVRYCTWLGRDLRYVGGHRVDRSTGRQLACSSLTCPERVRCRLHQDADRHAVELAPFQPCAARRGGSQERADQAAPTFPLRPPVHVRLQRDPQRLMPEQPLHLLRRHGPGGRS